MSRNSSPGAAAFDSQVTVLDTKSNPTRHLASSLEVPGLLVSIRCMAVSRAYKLSRNRSFTDPPEGRGEGTMAVCSSGAACTCLSVCNVGMTKSSLNTWSFAKGVRRQRNAPGSTKYSHNVYYVNFDASWSGAAFWLPTVDVRLSCRIDTEDRMHYPISPRAVNHPTRTHPCSCPAHSSSWSPCVPHRTARGAPSRPAATRSNGCRSVLCVTKGLAIAIGR